MFTETPAKVRISPLAKTRSLPDILLIRSLQGGFGQTDGQVNFVLTLDEVRKPVMTVAQTENESVVSAPAGENVVAGIAVEPVAVLAASHVLNRDIGIASGVAGVVCGIGEIGGYTNPDGKNSVLL